MNNNAARKQVNKGKKSSAAVAYASQQKTSGPKQSAIDRYSRKISHRELIGTVNGSIAFTATKYSLNPGIAATFPWLSTQAVGWEQYRFNRLRFEYVTRTSTATAGSVIMAPDYDPLDPSPASETYASSYMDASENATWVDQVCTLTPQAMFPLGPRKYVRSANVAGDLRTFDAGNFFLCTVEEAGADPIGKLWVEYEVELYVPQREAAAPSATRLSAFYLHGGSQALATGVSEAVETDTTIVDGCGIGAAVAGVFTPAAGTYKTTVHVVGGESAAEAYILQLQLWKNGAAILAAQAVYSDTVGAGANIPLDAVGYVTCNGTDTVQWRVTATGAAGALILYDECTYITFEIV